MEEKFCEKCGRIHPVKKTVVCPKCGREWQADYHDINPLCPACRTTPIEKAKKESGPTPKDLVDACQELKEQGWIPDEKQIMTVEESLEKEKKAEVKVEVVEAQVKEDEVEEIAEKVQQGLKEKLEREPIAKPKSPVKALVEEWTEEIQSQIQPREMSKEERIKFLLDEIFRIRRERLLIIEEIDKQIADVMDKLRDARSKLMNAGTKLEVQKWMAYIKSLTSEKTALDSRRHLVRMLHKEEARLRLELAKLETGKE